MLIYFCSSSHGFGHAARDAAVLQQLRRLRPEWTLVMSSGLPSPVLNLLLGDAAIEQRFCQWDVGMVQTDALGVDCAATLRALDELEQRLPALIEAEALWLASQVQPVLIIGDIPPAAAALAQRLDERAVLDLRDHLRPNVVLVEPLREQASHRAAGQRRDKGRAIEAPRKLALHISLEAGRCKEGHPSFT